MKTRNKIICGDCMKVMKQLPDLSFDVCSFSPPYSNGKFFDINKDFDKGGVFHEYLSEIARVSRVIGINFTQLIGKDGENSLFIEKLILNASDYGVELLDRWIIYKKVGQPARGNRVLNRFEYLLVFLGKGVSHNFSKEEKEKFKLFQTVFEVVSFRSKRNQVVTTTPYYEEIPMQMIGVFGREGSVVFDPFCGTGTTLKIAKLMGYDYFGIEIDDVICDQTIQELV